MKIIIYPEIYTLVEAQCWLTLFSLNHVTPLELATEALEASFGVISGT
jgi:hypothetical protein